MADNRLPSTAEVLVRIAGSKLSGRLDGQPGRDVARQRIMRGGLVGDEVEVLASADELGDDLGRVPSRPTDRGRPSAAAARIRASASSSESAASSR